MRHQRLWIHAVGMIGLLSTSCSISSAQSTNQAPLEAATSRWTQFRGPQGTGVLSKSPVPLPWTEDRVTKIPLPGTGVGSPVVWDDHVYLMAANPDDATRIVVAIDWRSEETVWTRAYSSHPHRLHGFSSYASTTPAADASGIYVAWADPEQVHVTHLDHAGNERWTRELGRYVSQHGFGTSPMVVGKRLILLNSQDAEELEQGVAPGEDRILALDTETGSTLWETPLPTRRVCYGVPAVRQVDGIDELVCATTGQGIFGMDLANGQIRWSHDCFKLRVCASMVLDGDLAIASHGSMGGRDNLLVAYDMKQQQERFRITRAAPYVPTPIAHGGLLFLWSDAGIVTCVRSSDGQVRWSERIGGSFFGSPVLLGDALVNVSDVGTVTILAASEGFQRLGVIETDSKVRSTLAATPERLLMRTEDALWVIRP